MKTLRQFQEQLPPPPSKAVVFMFGRFNPPTLGHEAMVESAIRVARKLGIQDVRLYASYSQDAKKNPILHEEKIKWLRKFFTGIEVVEDQTVRSPFDVARKLSEEGIKQVIMVAGSDRANEFQFRIGKYVNHPDPEKTFTFEDFTVVSCGRDPDATDASGVSASKMREFAAEANFESFVKGLPSLASDMDGKDLIEAIRRGMNLGESGIVVDERLSRINEDFALLTEAIVDKWWYNIRSKKFVAINERQETNHDWAPILFPKKFGLKETDTEKFRPSMMRGNEEIDGIKKIMFKNGWARASVVKTTYMAETKTFDDAVATIRALAKKLPQHPEQIFADYTQGPTNEGGGKFINLKSSRAIKTFLQTGKIIKRTEIGSTMAQFRDHRELLELKSFDKWWWNARTGLLVEVKTDWHVQQVVNNPETFGLSKDDQKVLFPPDAHKKDILPLLQSRLLKKGWVEVTYARGLGELVIRSGTPKEAQKALNRFLKIIPDPNEVRIGSGRSAIRLVGRQAISIFARTGKEGRVSPLSAFR